MSDPVVFPCGCGRTGPRGRFKVCEDHRRESRHDYPYEDKKNICYPCGCRYRYKANDGPCAMGHTVLMDSLTTCPTHHRITLVKTLRGALQALMMHDRIHPRSQ